MKTQVAATYVGGAFKPDEAIPLAEDTRVKLTVEILDDEPDEDENWDPARAQAAWQDLKEFLKKHPIHGGGKRYTRDELHERR